jgi:hypothetical protein
MTLPYLRGGIHGPDDLGALAEVLARPAMGETA